MNSVRAYLSLVLCVAALGSCAKERACPDVPSELTDRPVVFAEPQTRVMSERTQARGFTCLATRGGELFINNAITSDYGIYQAPQNPMYYWPARGTLDFYGVLPNVNMSYIGGRVSVPVGSPSAPLTGNEDYIVASTLNVANGRYAVPMSFKHILACISGITIETQPSVSTEIHSVSISHPAYGTFDVSSGNWSVSGTLVHKSFGHFQSLSAPNGKPQHNVSGDIPYSVIPGTYLLNVSYTETLGGISRQLSASTSVSLKAGCRNSISASLEPQGKGLSCNIEVLDWQNGGSWTEDGIEKVSPDPYFEVDFLYSGTPWIVSQYSIDGQPVYCSGNASEHGTVSGMTIVLTGYSEFTFYLFCSGENNYDYAIVGMPGEDLFTLVDENGWTMSDDMIGFEEIHSVVSRTGSALDNPSDISQYIPIELIDLDPNQTYEVQVVFGKDSSVSNGLDRAFIFIPEQQ